MSAPVTSSASVSGAPGRGIAVITYSQRQVHYLLYDSVAA